MADRNEFLIERHDDGKYHILRPNAERASGIADTQKGAIERAQKMDPAAAIHVERVRKVEGGGPDKWRKP